MVASRLGVCPEGYFSLDSPCSQAFLQAVVPLSIIVCAALALLPWPKPLTRALAPFAIIGYDQGSLRLLPELLGFQAPPARAIRRGPAVWRQTLLIALAGAMAVIWMVDMGLAIVQAKERAWHTIQATWPIWTSAGVAASWAYLTIYPALKPSARPEWTTSALYLWQTVMSLVRLGAICFARYVDGQSPRWASTWVIVRESISAGVGLALISLLMGLHMEDEAIVAAVPGTEVEDDTTLWQWLTFTWVSPMIALGASKDLSEEEVPNLSPTQTTQTSFMLLQKTLGSSLLRRLLKANAFDLWMDAIGTIIAAVFSFLSPYFIKQILDGIADRSREKLATAYIYAVLALIVGVAKALIDLQHLWYGRRASVRIKNQLIAAVYDKALRRKDASGVTAEKEVESKDGKGEKEIAVKKSSDSGRVVNLMASDANNIANTVSGMYWVYGAPFQIVIALAFLYSLLGWSAFAGVSTMILVAPVNRWFAKRSQQLTAGRAKATDKRIQIMNEVVQAISIVKFFAWTKKYRQKVAEARKVELDWTLKRIWNGIGYQLVWIIGPLLVSTLSFALFVLVQKGDLSVSVAFTSVSLFAQLRRPLTIIPTFYQMILRALVSLDRIETLLKEDEVEPWVCSLMAPQVSAEEAKSNKIGFRHATFRWNSGTSEEEKQKAAKAHASVDRLQNGATNGNGEQEPLFELIDLNVDFLPGKLNVITGPTGAGKTAMLSALLGEMERVSGDAFIPKHPESVNEQGMRNTVAYASQTAWLQNLSIKMNILFGEAMDEERYAQTIKACALEADFKALEDGDLTEIGSRGLALSGGQKARVALARAVYSRSAHLLVDDALAAVDSHTGRHLYEKCFKSELLRERTVILVTHHLELVLPGTDYLVQINDGRIETQGTPAELRKQGLLSRLVALEEASVDKHEAILAKKEVDKEALALAPEGEPAQQSTPTEKKAPRRLVQDEDRATGSVEWSAYKLYLVASTPIVWVFSLILLVLSQGSSVGERLWLSVWSSAYTESFKPVIFMLGSAIAKGAASEAHHQVVDHHATQQNFHAFAVATAANATSAYSVTSLPSARAHPGYYLGIYTAITLGSALIGLVQSMNSYWGGLKACRTLHDKMLDNVMGSTVRFFSTTPTGRILNRFSRDIDTIDGSLTSSIEMVFSQIGGLIASVALVATIVPAFLLPAVVISYGYYRLTVVYLECTRDLRRIEATRRSPIFSGFGELLEGITIVRAYSAERRFRTNLFAQVDSSQAAFYHLWMANRWLLVRMDSIGAASVFLTSIFALTGAVPAGLAGVAILSAQQFVEGCYWLSRFSGGLEQDFNSVERAKTYLELPQEPPAIIENHRPPAYWPSSATKNAFLRLDNVSIKYAPELPDVIKKVSFEVKPREKIGLIGRTGSGKSTMAMSLLRFTDPAEGKIFLDGIDITTIGVDDLRSRITYIPQEAVLFSGTVRENLDPFGEYTDAEMHEALQAVQLGTGETPGPSRVPSGVRLSELAEGSTASKAASTVVSAVPQTKVTLDSEVASGGGNFSQGQRQLLAMARALLRKSNLVIADEATASIDFATDEAIQKAIRVGFKDAAVLTIAHRISSVIDYDRLLVLDHGEVSEFDTPIALLRKESGIFKSLCEQSGRYQELFKAAEAAEKDKASRE